MSDSIQLNPSEDNELCFEISIEGSTTKESLDKSIFRFHLAEKSANGMSYTFPATKTGLGAIQVVIPQLSHVIKEATSYVGSLEVIIGGQYFVPQTVNVNFSRPLKVEAKGVVVNSKQETLTETKQVDNQRPKISSKIVSTVNTPSAPAKQQQTSATKKLSDYSPEQQLLIRKEILRMKKLQEQKKQETDILELDFIEEDEND